MRINFRLNGETITTEIEDSMRALDLLREDLGLTGTKEGCGEGECGACTIIVDGNAVNSCLMLAAELDGTSVETIEGLTGSDGKMHPVQRSFIDKGAVQCGFCIPGMIMSAKSLLDKNDSPSKEEIEAALEGNLCRCTGYVRIIEAVEDAASIIREDRK
ncbi:MAG TPA: (2Fe-2S)-binding protein [Kosmotogaceae bacterium]|nr:MAG: Aerobic-type carbon monoxide dehydrogenase, small subunit CoxS/CutS-like protein [Thermotogales bacterium 46_20]HAA84935.1 (2Fe-2S)-binding protein [Kosmotogaceae bacterium]